MYGEKCARCGKPAGRFHQCKPTKPRSLAWIIEQGIEAAVIAMLLTLLYIVTGPAYGAALTKASDYATAAPWDWRRQQQSLLVVKGTGTTDTYVLEADPATGQIPVDAVISFPYDTGPGAAGADTLRVVTSNDSTVITNMADSTMRIGDGTDELVVEADGSINVNSNMRTLDATTPGDNVQVMDPNTSTPLYIADDGSGHGAALVQANALPLPTGAATAANQTTANTSLSAIDTKLGGTLTVGLPSGAATSAKQDTINTTLGTLATQATLSTLDGKVANDYGASSGAVRTASQVGNASGVADFGSGAAGAQTLRTVLATRHEAAATPLAVRLSDGSAFGTPSPAGRSYADSARNDYSSVNVTTGAWVQLIASTAAVINELRIFDSCGEVLEIGTGAAAAETRKLLIPPGGFDSGVPLAIPAGTRVAIRAVSASCTTGQIVLTGLN